MAMTIQALTSKTGDQSGELQVTIPEPERTADLLQVGAVCLGLSGCVALAAWRSFARWEEKRVGPMFWTVNRRP